MPKTTRRGTAKQRELPDTLKRSPAKAQRTFAKVGDHWEPKARKGPSDPRAKHPRAREGRGKTYGGVDYEGHTKDELYERAAKLGVRGRSRMTKGELAEAIARKQ